ncbi:hypothetical protein BCR39DRAFT_535813 [Naematelia encephala]|uniref:FK506-binding protein n=1 Tax=Naematelia encephala TaxID=71784 RepID=A0A1Y2AZZ8_9TREE|nr:hypothetical protein BCR39DRAFT_535813 [Naematelia encephala]
MSRKLNLWSLTLLPGEKYPLYIRRDFQITNAALGEELRSKDGRSVVKVTHHPYVPLDDDSDSDDEFDSDLEDEMADEFELDSDEEAEAAKPKANGKIEVDEEDDEEDEGEDENDDEEDEDSEDEDDEFDSDDEVETSVICALTAGKIEQAQLELTFPAGDGVMFEVTGENAVHLTGNYILQPAYDQYSEFGDSDSEFDDEHDDYSDLIGSDEDDELDSEDEEVAGKLKAKIEEITEPAAKPKAIPAAEKPKSKEAKQEVKPDVKPAAPKRKAEEIESPAGKASESTEGLSKAQKKKLAKKAKLETPAAAPAKEATKGPQKKTLPSGLIIEDVKVGDGPVAKPGKRLGMRYIGKLENGKQFDANTAGKPFSFVLSRGEVIKGWDQGLAGMAVGGERRLTIPATLAYGSQKLPGIPKNSTLIFEVKLVSVA